MVITLRKTFGVFLIILSLGIGMFILYSSSKYSTITREFSSYSILSSLWERYKISFINKDGRVIDLSQNSITTSEGQSYALLRAVWMDDRPEFDSVLNFTQVNMKRPKDNLFVWKWGKDANGKYGPIQGGGSNSASDADSDIAMALILASREWHDTKYLTIAKKILPDFWKLDTDVIRGERYVIGGDWARQKAHDVANPSYFNPYAYRIFTTVDNQHDWSSLIDSGYKLINTATTQPLDGQKGIVAPDWVNIQRASGNITAPTDAGLQSSNGFDAMRIPWRIALDWKWNKDQRAYQYLTSTCEFYADEYKSVKKLATVYSHSGDILDPNENLSRYSTVLGCFVDTDPLISQDIYQNKIIKVYSNITSTFLDGTNYYSQNWGWFAIALYNNFLTQYGK